MRREKIAVMYGGNSAEHEISVITALQCIKAMDSRKYDVVPIYLALSGKWYTGTKLLEKSFYRQIPQSLSFVDEVTLLPDPTVRGIMMLPSRKIISIDACLLAFHGQFGEDGCVQGLLELADLPFTGCGVPASSVAMNKYFSKSIVHAHGIPTLPSVLIHKKRALSNIHEAKEEVLKNLSFPLFVKPNHLGSSIGISKVNSEEELIAAFAKVFQYDHQALVEPCLENILEMNIAVLDGKFLQASLVETPIATQGALSYEDKYLRGGSKSYGNQSSGMASLSRVIDPEDLDPAIKAQVKEYALEAFRVLDCSGVSRFDFMLEKATGKIYFNEVNPIPGSFSYYLYDKLRSPLLFTDLLEQLLDCAKERKAIQRSLNKEFGFHAL